VGHPDNLLILVAQQPASFSIDKVQSGASRTGYGFELVVGHILIESLHNASAFSARKPTFSRTGWARLPK
jgi:hypothetical protein